MLNKTAKDPQTPMQLRRLQSSSRTECAIPKLYIGREGAGNMTLFLYFKTSLRM